MQTYFWTATIIVAYIIIFFFHFLSNLSHTFLMILCYFELDKFRIVNSLII